MDDRMNTNRNATATTDQHSSTMSARNTSGQLDNTTKGQLAHLSEMDDFEIADGEPDIIGWDVCASNGTKIGDVEDLLVDSATMRVRYIEVELDKDLVPDNQNDRRHFLIPIGSARLDDDDDNVLVSMESERLQALPPYVRGALTREYEQSVVDGFAKPDGRVVSTDTNRDFYDDDDTFNDRRMFESRRELGRRDDAYLRRRSDA